MPLDAVALEVIRRQPRINQTIFVSLTGNPMTGTVLSKHNKRLREVTGIKEFHNHICRHSFATRALEKGMNIHVLSKILGHSSVAFTMSRYTNISNDFLFEQIQLMNK